jgi:hypothetical protein
MPDQVQPTQLVTGDAPRMTRTAKLAAGALLLLTLLLNISFIYRCGDGLSPWADDYSEAGSVRAAERFANEGFFQNYGLPDLGYGDRYPDIGIHRGSGKDPNDSIYHGYPPGPDWLSALQMRLFGPEHLQRLRILPVAVGMIGAWLFLLAMIRTIGAHRALLIYLACVLTPMFTNMTHGLHYQGNAFSLLLVQIAALLVVLGRPRPVGAEWMALFFLLGFIQGWLSFDYCFLVAFAAVPIALLVAPGGDRHGLRTVLLLIVSPGLGFIFAHGLHFLQSTLYFGSMRLVIEEYAYRAGKRYNAGKLYGDQPRWFVILSGIVLYAKAYIKYTHLFSPASILLTEAALPAAILSRASCRVGRNLRFRASFSARPRMLAGVASALVIGLLWLFAKPYHAINHISFVGRHLFLFYFSCCLFIAQATSMRIDRKRYGREHRWSARARSLPVQSHKSAGRYWPDWQSQ